MIILVFRLLLGDTTGNCSANGLRALCGIGSRMAETRCSANGKSASLSTIQPTSFRCSQAPNGTRHGPRVVALRACEQHHELVHKYTKHKTHTHTLHSHTPLTLETTFHPVFHHIISPLLLSPPFPPSPLPLLILLPRPSHTQLARPKMHTVLVEVEGERVEIHHSTRCVLGVGVLWLANVCA